LRGLDLAPGRVKAHRALAEIARAEHDPKGLRFHLEKAWEAAPDDPDLGLSLAVAQQEAGDWEASIAPLEKLRGTAGREVLVRLGHAYRRLGRWDDAERSFREVLARAPGDCEVLHGLAQVALGEKQPLLAELILAERAACPAEAAVHVTEGLVQAALQNLSGAKVQFEKAVAAAPAYVPALANLGSLALRFRDYEEAARRFEELAKLEPGNVENLLALAWAHEGQEGAEGPKKALAAFEKVLAAKPDHPEALHGIARLQAGPLRELAKAKATYQRLLESAGNQAPAEWVEELKAVVRGIEVEAQARQLEQAGENSTPSGVNP